MTNDNPFKCPKCKEHTFDVNGYPIGVVWAHQEINGIMQIQKSLPINGSPLYYFHDECKP